MKQVVVELEQTLTGVVVVELEDEQDEAEARRYVEQEPGEYQPTWEGGSVRALSAWEAGASCNLESRPSGFLWCDEHMATAKEGDLQCFHARELEAMAGVAP